MKTEKDGKGLLRSHLWSTDDLTRIQDRTEEKHSEYHLYFKISNLLKFKSIFHKMTLKHFVLKYIRSGLLIEMRFITSRNKILYISRMHMF